MTEDVKDTSVVEENVVELSTEEKAALWEKWVKEGINNLLDVFLVPAKDCNYNIKYYPHVVREYEGGIEYDDSKADGVLLSVMFTFEEPVVPLKPLDNK